MCQMCSVIFCNFPFCRGEKKKRSQKGSFLKENAGLSGIALFYQMLSWSERWFLFLTHKYRARVTRHELTLANARTGKSRVWCTTQYWLMTDTSKEALCLETNMQLMRIQPFEETWSPTSSLTVTLLRSKIHLKPWASVCGCTMSLCSPAVHASCWQWVLLLWSHGHMHCFSTLALCSDNLSYAGKVVAEMNKTICLLGTNTLKG